ncbi:hypothetical protein J6590_052852 [Homalodisca vitripennis]|nr:hypothetical protein J6590_052852 [Homalodisca vitripennis]
MNEASFSRRRPAIMTGNANHHRRTSLALLRMTSRKNLYQIAGCFSSSKSDRARALIDKLLEGLRTFSTNQPASSQSIVHSLPHPRVRPRTPVSGESVRDSPMMIDFPKVAIAALLLEARKRDSNFG